MKASDVLQRWTPDESRAIDAELETESLKDIIRALVPLDPKTRVRLIACAAHELRELKAYQEIRSTLPPEAARAAPYPLFTCCRKHAGARIDRRTEPKPRARKVPK